MVCKGVREKRGKKGEKGESVGGAFCWAFGEPKGLCGARANGKAEAKPLVRAQGRAFGAAGRGKEWET